MAFATQVIALSRPAAQQFESSEPYVVISLTDRDADHPDLLHSPSLKDRLSLQFDDICPGDAWQQIDDGVLFAMEESDAEQIAAFVHKWWGHVVTIVVHCHAGLSRSTGVAAAIRRHHNQDFRDLFQEPRSPNPHCLKLVATALVRAAN